MTLAHSLSKWNGYCYNCPLIIIIMRKKGLLQNQNIVPLKFTSTYMEFRTQN